MSYSRDRAIANESTVDKPLECTASGCPNRWSVDAGNGRLCSAHAWSERHLWPIITQEQIDAETDQALRNAAPPTPPPVNRAEAVRKLQSLRNIASLFAPPGVEWAQRLRRREEGGDRLTPTQREMWREALQWLRVESEKRNAPQGFRKETGE